jgi:hypothetical protein
VLTAVQVGANAERLPLARDDRDPGILLVAEASEGGVEIDAELIVDRVERVGPVVGDRRDVSVELVAHGAVWGHERSSHGALNGRRPVPTLRA